ncbi:MAG TPA: sulfatase-like hydrolase/transferase [Thermoanaerobaculia bacterium]|nr:sulfatase-like hydrolase/transferase [Thermoanaerobaculia bacterium]
MRRPFGGLARALLFFVLVACSRPIAHKDLHNANVLIVTLDTTRADHIGAYGDAHAHTPALDALAKESVLFEECVTPTAYTLPSHSSIMTGLYPPAHGVRVNGEAALPDSDTTLAERLASKGYRTGAFVSAFVLDGRWGISQGFQTYDDKFKLGPDQRLNLSRVRRPGNETVDAALQWLKEPSAKPFFLWVHLYDAHAPYSPSYDGAISFADSQVARLLNSVDKNHTIVVVVADHGEGLGEHGEDEHGYYIYDYAVHVPFILRIPGVRPMRVTSQVRTIDIAPTVMQLVADETPKEMQGLSLMPLIDGKKEPLRYAYSESVATKLQYGWAGLYGLRTNAFKFIQAPRSELYDLKNDPHESANLLESDRRVAVQLRNELAHVRADSDRRAPRVEEANVDTETMRKLASLGYLGGGSSANASQDESGLADPKDKMHLYDSVGYAANLIYHDDYKKAIDVLNIVLKDDPNVPQAQLLLVQCLKQTDQTEQAKAILDAYLKRDPANMPALIAMAEILEQEGRDDDVLAICRRALAKDDRNARAYEIMADVFMARNDHRDALPLLRKVVEIQPKLTRSKNNLAAALIGVGDLQEAEPLLQNITQTYPKFPLAWYHLGLLREKQGRPADARSAYETELANHPKEIPPRFNLGDLLLRSGDARGAEEQMRTLIREDPAGARPYLLLGQVLLDQPGRLREVEMLALQGLDRAKEADLKALGYFLLADVYSREGRRRELDEAVRKGQYFKAQIKS